MFDPAIFIAEPIKWEKGVKLFPPKIKDIIANPNYPVFAKIFTVSQEDIWDILTENSQDKLSGKPVEGAPNPFDFFMINCYSSEEFKQKAIEAFSFFTHEYVKIMPEKKILLFSDGIENVTDPKDLRLISTEEEFFSFQNAIRTLLGEPTVKPPNPNENEKIARMKALSRYRDKIKKEKGNQSGLTMSTMLVALCCMGIGLNPLNIGEITYTAASEIFSMMQNKEKYETDIKIMTAGFGSKKKITPKYWVRNSEKEK